MGKKRQRRRKSPGNRQEKAGGVRAEHNKPRQQLHTENLRHLQKPLGRKMERVFRGLEVPDKVQKSLVRIEQHLREFEQPMLAADEDPSARADIAETLLVMGAFTDDLRKDVDRLFEHYGRWLVSGGKRAQIDARHKLEAPFDRQPTSREAAKIDMKVTEALNKFWQKYNRTIITYHERMEDSGRPLLSFIGMEAKVAAESFEIQALIEHNVAEAIQGIPAGNIMEHQAAAQEATFGVLEDVDGNVEHAATPYGSIVSWNKFAYSAKYHDVKTGSDETPTLRPDMIHEWLQNADFETSEQPENFVLDNITVDGRRIIGRLHTSAKLHPFSVIGFEIAIEGVKDSITSGEISRLNSDLSPNGLFYMSMRSIFEGANMEKMYDRIREELLKVVYRKYEREQVPPGDRETLRDLLSEDPSVFGALPTEEEDGLTSWEEATLDVEDLGAEQDQFEIDDAPAETELPPPPPTPPVVPPKKFTLPSEEPERIAARPRERRPEQRNKLSIKKVKQKLIRLGAEVFTKKGDHPHFVGPSGKRVRFYNDHSSQRGRVLKGAQIRRVVEALGYTMEQFWAA